MITVGTNRMMNPTCNCCGSANDVLAVTFKGVSYGGSEITICVECRKELIKELFKTIPVEMMTK